MLVLRSLFGIKKKKFRVTCDISKEPVEKGYGYLLTTADVVISTKFWDNVMTEPDTLSYTVNYFKDRDPMSAQIRSMIFEKHSTVEKPWMISDSYIELFDIDRESARVAASQWWETEGNFIPKNSGKAKERLSDEKFREIKDYAIKEAGRERVIVG